MDTSTAEFQYVTGQMRESFAALFASFEERNTHALAHPGWALDVPYGAHPREVFDFRAAEGTSHGLLLYWHAGYWQFRDKAQFRFLAPALNALGWDVALLNYPLCPDVRVADITASTARALRGVLAHQGTAAPTQPVVLCGHSAGAHLAVELALQHAGVSAPRIGGVVAISGVFDLRPLRETSFNARLQLDAASAEACSPVCRARPGAAPALFVVGGTETPAFHAQTQAMAAQWRAQGNTTHTVTVADTDHFSVLDALLHTDGVLARALRTWAS